MKKAILLALALAGAFSVSGGPVIAQTSTSGPMVLADHRIRSGKLIGASVTDEHGMKLGTIVDVLVNGGAEEPTVVLKTRGKMIETPVSHLAVSGNKVVFPGMTVAMMAHLPAFTYGGGDGG